MLCMDDLIQMWLLYTSIEMLKLLFLRRNIVFSKSTSEVNFKDHVFILSLLFKIVLSAHLKREFSVLMVASCKKCNVHRTLLSCHSKTFVDTNKA